MDLCAWIDAHSSLQRWTAGLRGGHSGLAINPRRTELLRLIRKWKGQKGVAGLLLRSLAGLLQATTEAKVGYIRKAYVSCLLWQQNTRPNEFKRDSRGRQSLLGFACLPASLDPLPSLSVSSCLFRLPCAQAQSASYEAELSRYYRKGNGISTTSLLQHLSSPNTSREGMAQAQPASYST
eukprot:1156593-Pelagomonas_calceolata.AAC.7